MTPPPAPLRCKIIVQASILEADHRPARVDYDGLVGRAPTDATGADLDRDAVWEGAFSKLSTDFNTLLGLAADSNRCQAAASSEPNRP